MKQLSIKDLIEFRNKSDKAQKNFISNIKIDKEKTTPDESGGDYWVSCLSAIGNAYKSNNLQLIADKRTELEGKLEATEYDRTKNMYKRNIDILYKYEYFDFEKLKPSKEIIYRKKQGSILHIKGLELKVMPKFVFTFKLNEIEEVGAIWFIAKLGGYRKDELGMFTDILYRFLTKNFPTNYVINSKYCIAVDVYNQLEVSYLELETAKVASLLSPTLDDMLKLMK